MSRDAVSMRSWRYWRGPIVFVCVMLLFRSAIADWNQVPSASMEPSILIGDRIVVDKLAYQVRVPFTQVTLAQLGAPQRGDVVTFVSPQDAKLLVKRVIGLPGDRIAMVNNRLTINDVAASYELIARRTSAAASRPMEHWLETIDGRSARITWRTGVRSSYQSFPEIQVPPDHYLMLGRQPRQQRRLARHRPRASQPAGRPGAPRRLLGRLRATVAAIGAVSPPPRLVS